MVTGYGESQTRQTRKPELSELWASGPGRKLRKTRLSRLLGEMR